MKQKGTLARIEITKYSDVLAVGSFAAVIKESGPNEPGTWQAPRDVKYRGATAD